MLFLFKEKKTFAHNTNTYSFQRFPGGEKTNSAVGDIKSRGMKKDNKASPETCKALQK